MNTELMFSSEKMDWETPQSFFNELNKVFRFNLDPCASSENAKCDLYLTEQDDGLSQDWEGFRVFCNPPYGRALGEWVKKCHNEGQKEYTTVVMLIPARPDTTYTHDYIFKGAKAILYIKGRLKFGNSKNSAPFPSQVVIYSDNLSETQEETLSKYGFLIKLK